MIWSKLKRAVETLQAEAVREHLGIHLARYGPGVSAVMARAWLTWDGVEFANFSSAAAYNAQRAGASDERASGSLMPSGSRDDFIAALEAYVALPLDAALRADDPLVRGMAYFDRRLGKRRIQEMRLAAEASPFARRCFVLRQAGEGAHHVG
jgi:hypothetical protein